MYTVRNGDKFILKLSGLDIEITAKEYTMLNNIIQRTITKYDCEQLYIGGRITSYCTTNYDCYECPYQKYCDGIHGSFYQTYYREEYDKYIIYSNLLRMFNINDKRKDINVLWNNTMEELLHYTEGEI